MITRKNATNQLVDKKIQTTSISNRRNRSFGELCLLAHSRRSLLSFNENLIAGDRGGGGAMARRASRGAVGLPFRAASLTAYRGLKYFKTVTTRNARVEAAS